MADVRKPVMAALKDLAELTVLDEQNPQSFRVRAYEGAVLELEGFTGDLKTMTAAQLAKLRGIGKSTAAKIREFIDTGKIDKLEKLRKKFPAEVVQMSKLPGMGPKTLHRIRTELGIESIEELKEAVDREQLRELSGMGKKTEEKLARAIERMGLIGGDKRTPISQAMRIAQQVVEVLSELPEVKRIDYCGSLRRHRETVGDIDIIVASEKGGPVMECFATLPEVRQVLVRGDTKTSIVTDKGLQIDLRVVLPDQYGAAILYFTGSKNHNIKLRQLAIDRGWILNEYGLSDTETGKVVASETEDAIYDALGLVTIPPPMREDTGEIEASKEGTLPATLTADQINGDLHCHSTMSGDGRSTLAAMVERADHRGFTYLAITDHAENLAMIGASRESFLEQRDELHKLQDQHQSLKLLHGVELNIGPDGGLDYDADFRMTFDWCVAAVHSHFDLDQATQTKRIIDAMKDPAVHAIGHLSSRMIGKRPPMDMDVDAILEAAAETGTAIEINAALPRLDCAADVLRRARDRGVTFVISTDSHHVDEYMRMEWGARQAQRGWVDPEKVANTWDLERFYAWTSAKRERFS